jgi:hypothetical protein
MSQAKLSGCLVGERSLDRIPVQMIFHALDVDVLKAQFALGNLCDWHRYYDPDIEVIPGLVAHLPDSLRVSPQSGSARYPQIHPPNSGMQSYLAASLPTS